MESAEAILENENNSNVESESHIRQQMSSQNATVSAGGNASNSNLTENNPGQNLDVSAHSEANVCGTPLKCSYGDLNVIPEDSQPKTSDEVHTTDGIEFRSIENVENSVNDGESLSQEDKNCNKLITEEKEEMTSTILEETLKEDNTPFEESNVPTSHDCVDSTKEDFSDQMENEDDMTGNLPKVEAVEDLEEDGGNYCESEPPNLTKQPEAESFLHFSPLGENDLVPDLMPNSSEKGEYEESNDGGISNDDARVAEKVSNESVKEAEESSLRNNEINGDEVMVIEMDLGNEEDTKIGAVSQEDEIFLLRDENEKADESEMEVESKDCESIMIEAKTRDVDEPSGFKDNILQSTSYKEGSYSEQATMDTSPNNSVDKSEQPSAEGSSSHETVDKSEQSPIDIESSHKTIDLSDQSPPDIGSPHKTVYQTEESPPDIGSPHKIVYQIEESPPDIGSCQNTLDQSELSPPDIESSHRTVDQSEHFPPDDEVIDQSKQLHADAGPSNVLDQSENQLLGIGSSHGIEEQDKTLNEVELSHCLHSEQLEKPAYDASTHDMAVDSLDNKNVKGTLVSVAAHVKPDSSDECKGLSNQNSTESESSHGNKYQCEPPMEVEPSNNENEDQSEQMSVEFENVSSTLRSKKDPEVSINEGLSKSMEAVGGQEQKDSESEAVEDDTISESANMETITEGESLVSFEESEKTPQQQQMIMDKEAESDMVSRDLVVMGNNSANEGSSEVLSKKSSEDNSNVSDQIQAKEHSCKELKVQSSDGISSKDSTEETLKHSGTNVLSKTENQVKNKNMIPATCIKKEIDVASQVEQIENSLPVSKDVKKEILNESDHAESDVIVLDDDESTSLSVKKEHMDGKGTAGNGMSIQIAAVSGQEHQLHTDASGLNKNEDMESAEKISTKSKTQTCIVCKKVTKCKFNIVRGGDTKQLCDEVCFKKFRKSPGSFLTESTSQPQSSSVNKLPPLQPKPSSVTTTTIGTAASTSTLTTLKAALERTPATSLNSLQPPSTSSGNQYKTCSVCQVMNINAARTFCNWKGFDFCGELCLGKFQSTIKTTCSNCGSFIPNEMRASYCAKIGNAMHPFCKQTCFSDFMKILRTCASCQQDLSQIAPVVVATVGVGDRAKEFCSTECVQKMQAQVSDVEIVHVEPGLVSVDTCSVCKSQANTAKHTVRFHSKTFKLCSDICLSAFQYTNNIALNKCSTCGNMCTAVESQAHLIQFEGDTKRFCSNKCVDTFRVKNRKLTACSWCAARKINFDMIERQDENNKYQLFCSLNCLSLFRVNLQAKSNLAVECDKCKKIVPAQYHLTMSDASVRNFCTYECVMAFQSQFTSRIVPPLPPLGAAASQKSIQQPTQKPLPSSNVQQQQPPPVHQHGTRNRGRREDENQVNSNISPKLSDFMKKKLAVLAELEKYGKKPNITRIANKFGINRRTVGRIIVQKDKIKEAEKSYSVLKRKNFKEEDIDEALFQWFCAHHEEGVNIDHSILKQKAKQFATEMGNDFEPSDSWLCRFTAHHNINLKLTFGEHQSDDRERVIYSLWHSTPISLNKYEAKDTFNTDGISSVKASNTKTKPSQNVPPISNSASIPVISNVMSLAPEDVPPPPDTLNGQQLQEKAVSALLRNLEKKGTLVTGDGKQRILVEAPLPKMLKNKGTQCKPVCQTKATACRPHSQNKEVQTDEQRGKPVIIPVPVPIYIPMPTVMYTAPTPVPIPFPVPIPVPIFIPTTRKSANGIMKAIKEIQDRMPADPLEAEMLMMAEAVATDKKPGGDSDTDSEAEPGDNDFDTVADEPESKTAQKEREGTAGGSGGAEDMIQMALRMAEEMSGPVEDLESSVQPVAVVSGGQRTLDESVEETPSYNGQEDPDFVPVKSGRGRGTKRASRGRPPSATNRAKRPRSGRINYTEQEDEPQEQSIPVNLEPPPDKNYRLKFTYGVNAWKHWVVTKNAEWESANKKNTKIRLFPLDVLKCTMDELHHSLCLFIKEVRKPNGEVYSPDSIYYLCLGIQQYLYENGRIDNIFTDLCFQRFTDGLHEVLKTLQPKVNSQGQMLCRIEEEHLWESKQLGAHSPYVLLNTLIYFHTKHFILKTATDHMSLSFAQILKHWKKGVPVKGGVSATAPKNASLRFYCLANNKKQDNAALRKGKEGSVPVYEVTENFDYPLRCPVKLYEFFLSKCPESIKNRNDIFYPIPERSCVPDSPVWYSTQSIQHHTMDKMLTRILLVREIQEAHLHAQPTYIKM